MNNQDITYLSMAVGLLLLALPVFFFYRFGVRHISSTLVAATRMVVQLFLIGLYLKYLFLWNDPFINILWVMVMVMVATFTASKRTHIPLRTLFIPMST